MGPSSGIRATVVGTVVMALVSTFADALWAAAIPEHRATYGIVHGAIVLSVLGLTLAGLVGARPRLAGALAGLLIGAIAAAAFYVLYPLVGVVAMLLAWMGLWLAFAFLVDALAPPRATERLSRTVARAVAAAVLSGLAFWAISGIWLGPWDPGPLYLANLASWCVAFLPGFGSLLLGRPGVR